VQNLLKDDAAVEKWKEIADQEFDRKMEEIRNRV